MGWLSKTWHNLTSGNILDVALNLSTLGMYSVYQSTGEMAWTAFKHLLIPDMRRDREAQVQSATNARTIVYGRSRVGNQIAYGETTGSGSQIFHIFCLHAGHEVDGFEEIYFDDKLVATAADGWAIQAPYTGKATIEFYDGTQTSACASMVGASAGGWTSDHKLLGVAYTHVTLTYDEAVYPAGTPSVKAVLRGKKIYDPRTGKTQWSDNPALCIRDYMLTPKEYGGMGCDADEIDEAAFLTAANICDETVYSNIPSDQAAGVKTVGDVGLYPETRYTLNGVIKLDGTPTQFIRDMLTSCGGEAVYSCGVWKIYAAAPSTPVAVINESWLNGGMSFQTGGGNNDKTNTAKGTFTNSNDYWADTEFPQVPSGVSTPPNASYWSVVATPERYNPASTYAANQYVLWASKAYKSYNAVPINSEPPSTSFWSLIEEHDNSLQYPSAHTVQRGGVVYVSTGIVPVSNPYITEDGGEVLTANLSLPFTITSSEAQRLAKIALNRSRLGFTMSYPCNHRAFELDINDVVYVENNRLGMDKLFQVKGWSFSLLGGVALSLSEYSDGAFDWSATDSTPLISPVINGLPDPYTVTAPTSLTASDAAVVYTGDVTRSETTFSWVATSALGTTFVLYLDGNEYVTTINSSYIFRDILTGAHTFGVKAISTSGAASAIVSISHTVTTVNGTITTTAIGAVPDTRTVNGHDLSTDVTVTASDVGLGNVTNESKATMFTAPSFTSLSVYADNAAASSLLTGELYRTSTGQMMIKY